ncbi:Sophorolipid transporter [Vanrija pseudolonga]|uniref:Sophorolipid transporter n=1 Tax=Vanrija pseudolonga TaxID=143232 RepID=A0AAF0YER5_9TREE|nr:Sophorolipid transporter [Vanrija pseudolonga]
MTTSTASNNGSQPRQAEKPTVSKPGSVAGSSSNTANADAVKPKQPDNSSDSSDAVADESHEVMLKPVGLFALFRFATPFERLLNFIGLVIAAAAGATLPVMTIIFGKLTTAFTNFAIISSQIHAEGSNADVEAALEAARHHLKKEAGNSAIYLMVIGIGMFATTYAYMLIWNYTSEAQGKRIRERYLRAVLRQDIAWFDQMGAGEVATRIQTDCHLVQASISEKIAITIQHVSTFIAGFVVAYARQPRLAGVLTTILPVIIVAGGAMGYFESKYQTVALHCVSKAGTIAEEVISSIRTVQAFATGKLLGEQFNKKIEGSRKAGVTGASREAASLCVMFFAVYAAYALAFVYGGRMVESGKTDSGAILNVFFAILIGSFSIVMIAPEMQSISKGRAAAAKLFETIDRIPEIDSANDGGERPASIEGTLTFDDVKFHYPSRPDVPVLKGLSTVFEAGKTCALVGASGSGKSTVIQLLERFYDPIAGRILLDGRDIRTLNLKWLRQQIGLVSQEPTLFATTVRGNVEHGLIGSKWEHASDAERFELVKKACVAANADGFISKLPKGYDTNVGERGMLLSGGQKQRVAIARAIVSNPVILLLDEATSALDGQSERVVQDALDRASVGRTTIVIAHRLATVKNADKILVMGGGEIIEQGTHNSLLEDEHGAYFKLVTNQKLQQEAADHMAQTYDEDGDSIDEVDKIQPVPGSPVSEKVSLHRHVTGRSIASQILEQRRAERDAFSSPYDRKGFFALFGRLLKLNGPHWRWYVGGVAGSVASGMVFPGMAILFGKTMANFELPRDEIRPVLDRKALWFFIIAILAAIAMFFNYWCFSTTGWELATTLRKRLFAAVVRHDIEWFDEEQNATGTVTSNIADQPQKVQGLFGVTLGSILQAFVTLVGGAIVGLAYAPLLSLIGIACVPLIVGSGYIRLRVVVLKDEQTKKWHASSSQMASEAAASVRTVASLTREDDVEKIYGEALQEPMRISNRTAFRSQALYAASQGIVFLVIALVFYIGALWIASGRLTTATFFTSLMGVIFAAMEAGDIFQYVPDASKAGSSARSIFRVIDNVPTVDADSTDGIVLNPAEVRGHLTLNNVHFRYPSRPDVRVLRNCSIDIPAGKYVALVGPSGCGKSTSIQLIERFYDPLAGSVTLDGVDIRTLNVASYRSQIALVSQEPTLYSGSVHFNILLGHPQPDTVSDEQLKQACLDANILEFIESLPEGFDTEVGSKGGQLSGGQKQRMAIARALVRNPKVLLLDEATAALDSNSERVVQAALDNASLGRTVVAIAHRLSTIQNADMIYFINEGTVVERGTHAELLALKGAYYELVQMQNLSRVD